MKLQQLHYIVEVFNHNLNISSTAGTLDTSQPSISKQMRLLENELGVQIFERNGKHLTKLTPAGQDLIHVARDVLFKIENIKSIAREHAHPEQGALHIATTDLQLRYQLPAMINGFAERYPHVGVHICQHSPKQIMQALIKGDLDFAVATNLPTHDDIIMLPCYQWQRAVVVKTDHILAQKQNITLQDLVPYPLITYSCDSLNCAKTKPDFDKFDLSLRIIFTASDSAILKSYVRLGLGVGVIAKMAVDPNTDRDLSVLESKHIFSNSMTKIAFLRGKYLRSYMYNFIQRLAPHLTRANIDTAVMLNDESDIMEMFSNFQLPVR